MVLYQLLQDPLYFTAAVLTVFTLLYVFRGKRYSWKLPPGPKPWPILGNIPYMRRQGLQLYEIALKLRKQYGDIVHLKLGPVNDFVLIMGPEKVRKAAVDMNDQFKFRPTTFYLTNRLFQNKGLVFANGDAHAAMRKLTLGTMRDFGVGKRSLEEKIQEEAGMLCDVFENKGGKPYYFLNNCKMAVANIIAGIVYGSRLLSGWSRVTQYFLRLIADVDTLFKDVNLFLPENFIPILRFLPGSKLTKVLRVFEELRGYARSRIEEHRETFDPDNTRDFVDVFLKHEGSVYGAISEESLFRVIVELFNAGTDTTATTIIWAIIHLIRNPDMQDKCRKEIYEVVGTGRNIGLEDKRTLHYLQAFINETLRYCTIAPQAAPHTVLEDTDFEGYTIPKNSIVLFILYTLLMDKETLGDPENFRSERFLDDKGHLRDNIEAFKPFSLGGRSCVGKHLARMELFIFLGTLIQRFEFKSPPGKPLPSARRIQTGITSQPEKYEFCAIPISSQDKWNYGLQ